MASKSFKLLYKEKDLLIFSGLYLLQVRSQLYQEDEPHGSEQERMRSEISDLTEELHQKEITIATIMKKAALLERQLKMELEIREKMLARQQVWKWAGQHPSGSLS